MTVLRGAGRGFARLMFVRLHNHSPLIMAEAVLIVVIFNEDANVTQWVTEDRRVLK